MYRNDGAGGPIDYASPVATVSGLTWTHTSPGNGRWSYAVRARDTSTSLVERNADAVVDVTISGGADVTARPDPPTMLSVGQAAPGSVDVTWAWIPKARRPEPTGFRVYVTAGTSVSYASPAATVPYARSRAGYTARVSGLTPGSTYAVGVRSYNAAGSEANAAARTIAVAPSTAPANPTILGMTADPPPNPQPNPPQGPPISPF